MFNIIDIFSSHRQLKDEKARLEAFLSAVPGEYCGWALDGTVVYSKGFCDALGLERIENFSDIQNVLTPDDSPVIEGMFNRLKQDGTPFTINVQDRACLRTCKISGTRGSDLTQKDYFHILWLEDITDMKSASDMMRDEQDVLHAEMAKLQDSLDALPYAVWIRDADQKIIWCNVSYAKLLNLVPSKIIAEQREIISATRKRKPSEKQLIVGADLARQAIEKSSLQTVTVHQVLAGKRLLIKITENPIKLKGHTVGLMEDITNQESIQADSENNQAAMRDLLEQLRSAVSIFNADQTLAFYNSSFSELWGLEEGWLNTRPKLGDLMEKLRETRRLPEQADFKSFKKSWIDMFTTLIGSHDEMLYLPDGSAFRMLVVPHKLGGLMMTFEDVTSRLELESSYNTLIAVQKETLDNLAESVAVYGGDGRLKLWNPAFSTLWAFDPETLSGEPHITRITEKMAGFFAADAWPQIKETMVSLGLDRASHEGRFGRKDDLLINYATVPLPDGGVLITYTDVTDTVRVENALREKNIALEAAEQLKLDFLANVSYQLRTPLNAIMGFNEMLDQEFFGSLNTKQKEYTHDINAASERLLNLINDVLDLSTIEAGQMHLSVEKTSVKDMMESVLDLVKDWARKEKIEVSLSCPQNIGKADLDESRMKQAIVNLVRNSITYTSEGGKIELSAARSKDMIKFVVSDNGTGIDADDQRRVLEPFERSEAHQQVNRGAGLGLTLVRNIVSLHHGEFDLHSEAGKGTTVTIMIPKVLQDDI